MTAIRAWRAFVYESKGWHVAVVAADTPEEVKEIVQKEDGKNVVKAERAVDVEEKTYELVREALERAGYDSWRSRQNVDGG